MNNETSFQDLDGYVCAYESKNPSLPGHLVVFRAALAGIQEVSPHKWAVVHFHNGKPGNLAAAKTLKIAKTSASWLATLNS